MLFEDSNGHVRISRSGITLVDLAGLTCPPESVPIGIRSGRRKGEGLMSRSRHTEAQIIAALKQVEAGRTTDDVAGCPIQA